MDRFSLEGKVIVVTGAAGILGSRFCDALLEYGAQVIGLDSNSQALTELTKRQLSTRLTTYCVDIRDREALRLVHDAVFE